MRAKSVNFERGKDPKDSLGLGSIEGQKKIFDDLLSRLEEAGIKTTFYGSRWESEYLKPEDREIGATVDIFPERTTRSYSVYREKNNMKWEFIAYYNTGHGWNSSDKEVLRSSKSDDIFYFFLQKAEEAVMKDIGKVDKTIASLSEKKKKLQKRAAKIQKYNES